MRLKKLVYAATSMRVTAVLMILLTIALLAESFLLGGEIAGSLLAPVLYGCLLLSLVLCLTRQTVSLARGHISLARVGTYVFHVGIVVVMLGAAMNQLYGFKRSVWISQTEPIDAVAEGLELGAQQIRLLDLTEAYDESGMLQTCDITLAAGDETTTVQINKPGRLQAIKVYYADTVNGYRVRMQDGGAAQERIVYDGETIPVGDRWVRIYRYLPYYNARLNAPFDLQEGSAHILCLTGEAEDRCDQPQMVVPGDALTLEDGSAVEFTGRIPYVLLMFKYDPGLPVTALGGLLLGIGAVILAMRKDRE